MDIKRVASDGVVDVTVDGRVDGYWADHLEQSLSEAVREGHHHLRINLSRATFLSSAGIAVLMRFYKQLMRINGSIVVVEPSAPVRIVLDMMRLSSVLVEAPGPIRAAGAPAGRAGKRIDRPGVQFEVFELDAAATVTCRAIGASGIHAPASDAAAGGGSDEQVVCPESRFALGVGAFGATPEDCRERYGELLAAAGAAVYLPADGSNVPDYLVASDLGAPEPRLLHGLACDGPFASLARFDTTAASGPATLATLADACLEIAGADAAGVVMVAESAGLVGAALRRSPATLAPGTEFFAHPGIRDHLTFTAERAFTRTLALIVGVVSRAESAVLSAAGEAGAQIQSHLRPLGAASGSLGHFHAAAFSFRPFRKGEIQLKETVRTLFETESVLGVLHLLNDDREAVGAGQSEFIRGACWVSPIRGEGM